MSEENIFLLLDDQETGPFSIGQVTALLDQEKITLQTLYARPGMTQWEPLIVLLPAPGCQQSSVSPQTLPVNQDTAMNLLKECMADLSGLSQDDSQQVQRGRNTFSDKEITITIEATVDVVSVDEQDSSPPNKEIQTEQVLSPEKIQALESVHIFVNGNSMTAENLDFWGKFSPSPSSQYIVAWNETGYLLFDGVQIVLRGSAQNVEAGTVSNVGTFVINRNTTGESGIFEAFLVSGERILRHTFKAELDSNGISEDGRFAICQTNYGFTEQVDNLAALFDLADGRMVTKFHPELGRNSIPRTWHPRSFLIDPSIRTISFLYEKGPILRYGFDGTLLDPEKWDCERLNYASGYELLETVEAHLHCSQANDDRSIGEMIGLLNQALVKGVSEFTQAKIHRLLGEFYHQLGDKIKALYNFERALALNPKVGVKKMVAHLKGCNGTSGWSRA